MTDSGARPPYKLAALTAGLVLLVYVLTLAPTVTFWDAGEFIAASKTLGIPHPPGTPFFVLVAHVWAMLVPIGEYAVRTNLLSATASSAGAGFFFLVLHETLSSAFGHDDRRWAIVGAMAATALGAFTFTNWQNSNETEVYAAATCTIAMVSWLVLVWRRRRDEQGGGKYLLLIVYLFGLAVGTHLLALLAAPAVLGAIASTLHRAPARDATQRNGEVAQLAVLAGVWLLLVGGGLGNAALLAGGVVAFAAAAIFAMTRGRARFALSALALAVLGATPYLFAYIRATQHAPLNEADPSTWQSLVAVIGRRQYGIRTPFDDPTIQHGADNPGRTLTLIGLQLVNYFEYFDWQWARSIGIGFGTIVTLVMTTLGIRGFTVHRRADRDSWWLFFLLCLVTGLGLVAYMNFKPGFSLGWPMYPAQADHEVRERDYFFVVSFVVWGMWAGIGAITFVRGWRTAVTAMVPLTRARVVAIVAIALVPVALNWQAATRKGPDARLAADTAYNLLNSVPPYGILFTYGDNDTFPLWWAQQVAGIRRDVTVVCLALANTDWYMRQLRDAKPDAFDGAGTPFVWRSKVGERPTWPMHTMSDASIEKASQTSSMLDRPLEVDFGPFKHTFPAQTIFQPSDFVSIQILRQNLGRRPIVFAITTGADFLGLKEHVVMQGLGYRVVAGADSTNPDIDRSRFNATGLDVGLTDTLAWSAFRYGHLEGRTAGELETTSSGFANSFAIPFTQLAFTYAARGDSTRAVRNLERAAAISDDTTLTQALRQVRGR